MAFKNNLMYKEIFNKETNNDLQNTIQKTQQ